MECCGRNKRNDEQVDQKPLSDDSWDDKSDDNHDAIEAATLTPPTTETSTVYTTDKATRGTKRNRDREALSSTTSTLTHTTSQHSYDDDDDNDHGRGAKAP